MSEYNELAEAARMSRKTKGVTREEEAQILEDLERIKRVQDENRRQPICQPAEGISGYEIR